MLDTLKKNWSVFTPIQQQALIADATQVGLGLLLFINTLRLTSKRNYGAAVVNAVLLVNATQNTNARVARRDALNPSANYQPKSKVV